MNYGNFLARLIIFQCLTDLLTSHVELTGIILVEVTGQRTKRFLSGEGDGADLNFYQLGKGWDMFDTVQFERGRSGTFILSMVDKPLFNDLGGQSDR